MSISSILSDPSRGLSRSGKSGTQANDNTFAETLKRASAAQSETVGTACPPTSAGELSQKAENQLSEFKRAVQQLFAQAGIDSSTEIRLESDGAGGIQVDPNHPDADKIEQLLKDNPDLVAKFKQLQAAFGQVRDATEEPQASDSIFAPVFNVTFRENEAHAAFN